jgi:hypothetical protein
MRAANARRARIIRHLREIFERHSGRSMIEITIRLAELPDALHVLDELAVHWLEVNPHLLRAVGGDEFITEFVPHIRGDR